MFTDVSQLQFNKLDSGFLISASNYGTVVGVTLVLLDWPESGQLPPLVCACVLAKEATLEFLKNKITDKNTFDGVESAISHIYSKPEFVEQATQLKRSLREPTLGLSLSIEKNKEWLTEIFSNKRSAKTYFGQPLSPNASSKIALQPRTSLVSNLTKVAFSKANDNTVAIIGNEGCGKSWLFAQTWCQIKDVPLTVLAPASEIIATSYEQLERLLIEKIITQTNDSLTDSTILKWRRRFKQWKAAKNNNGSPRLIVFIDGLNQNAKLDWSHIVDSLSNLLDALGGNLILSCRLGFYNANLKDSLLTKINVIQVQEWDLKELESILSEVSISIASINERVISTIKNPRILSVALSLLDNEKIINFSELNAERLLFEHMLASSKDYSSKETHLQFKERLAKHAHEIIERLQRKQKEDRLVFELGNTTESSYNLTSELMAASEGLFFHTLDDDPSLYSLSNDGLSLALGIALIKTLQKSKRNNKALEETLAEIVEPIAALDMTSTILLSAFITSSLDESCPEDIGEALLLSYINQQNIDYHEYFVFSSAVRSRPSLALNALKSLSSLMGHKANKEWLLSALHELGSRPNLWRTVMSHFDEFLRYYSLSPELSVHAYYAKNDKSEYDKKISEREKIISKKLKDLSGEEKIFIDSKMTRNDAINTSELSADIFRIISDSCIAPLADAIMAWAFSQSINSSMLLVYDVFNSLIRFNNQDWEETRSRLLSSLDVFSGPRSSSTARWAAVAILRATATREDAEKCTVLIEDLTKDREKFPGWRRVEKYCSSDPCDPSSSIPENIKRTVNRLNDISIEDVHKSRSMTEVDIFLRDSLTGLVRFLPDDVIYFYRNFAKDLAARDASLLQYSLPDMVLHTPLYDGEMIEHLINSAYKITNEMSEGTSSPKESWTVIQYLIFSAFYHVDGDRQLEVVSSILQNDCILLRITETFRPASRENLQEALQNALRSDNENLQINILAFARFSGIELTQLSRKIIGNLFDSSSSAVRAQALNVIGYIEEVDLMRKVVHSGWKAALIESPEKSFEAYYGSYVLICAGKVGILEANELIDRISPSHYGMAARTLGDTAKLIVARMLGAAFDRLTSTNISGELIRIEKNSNAIDEKHPPLISIVDSENELSPEDAFERSLEPPEDFERRHNQKVEALQAFKDVLSGKGVSFLVDDVGHDAIQALVMSSPDTATEYANAFLSLPRDQKINVTNVALMLAQYISEIEADLAKELFEQFGQEEAYLSITEGLAGIPLPSTSIWESADNDIINAIKTKRLYRAKNDHELFIEVLAALTSDSVDLLTGYARALLDSERPVDKARALMIFGFSDASPETEIIFDQYEGSKGFIGEAFKAAKYAYDRNKWSRHWYKLMCATDSPEEFWRYGILLTKIVDGRFEIWLKDFDGKRDPATRFSTCFNDRIKKRIGDWRAKRQKTLFGGKVPEDIF